MATAADEIKAIRQKLIEAANSDGEAPSETEIIAAIRDAMEKIRAKVQPLYQELSEELKAMVDRFSRWIKRLFPSSSRPLNESKIIDVAKAAMRMFGGIVSFLHKVFVIVMDVVTYTTLFATAEPVLLDDRRRSQGRHITMAGHCHDLGHVS